MELWRALKDGRAKVIEDWLKQVFELDEMILPLTDSNGAVDPNAFTFRAGQVSVVDRIRETTALLERKFDAPGPA